MIWQEKVRKLLHEKRLSKSALGRGIGHDTGRTVTNWLDEEEVSKPHDELFWVRKIADFLDVNFQWLSDPDTEFPAIPKGGEAATPTKNSPKKAHTSRDPAPTAPAPAADFHSIVKAWEDPGVRGFLVESLAAFQRHRAG